MNFKFLDNGTKFSSLLKSSRTDSGYFGASSVVGKYSSRFGTFGLITVIM